MFKTAGHFILLGLFLVVAYYPGLRAPFVFDDIHNIVLNPAVQPGSITEIFRAIDTEVSATRPLAMVSFAVNFLLGGLDVYGYHVFNLIIHFCTAGILYYCIVSILTMPGSRLEHRFRPDEIHTVAFWSMMLWALNPVQHQAVTYIVQRMTSLATLFYLLAMLCFLKFRAGQLSARWAMGLITFSFAAGMACKEIVITMPVALILIDRVLIRSQRQLDLKWITAIAAVVVVICLIYTRTEIPDLFAPYPNWDYSPYQRLLTEPRVLWDYLSILFMPTGDRLYLVADIEVSRTLLQPLSTLLSILAIPAALLTGWLLRNRAPALFFATVFYFLASSVEASFLNLGLAYLHRLYLPSLFVFFGLLTCMPVAMSKYLGPICIVIAALFAYGTQQRNEDWRDSVMLWKSDYSKNSSPGMAVVNGAIALVKLGRYDDAITLIQPAVDRLSGNTGYSGLHALAMAHFYLGDYAVARSTLEKVGSDYEDYGQVLLYQGLALLNLNLDAGIQVDRLRQEHPDKPYAAILTAELSRRAGRFTMAIEILEALKTASIQYNAADMNLARAYLANVYLDMKLYDQAYALYLDIINIDPDAYFAWQQIYAMQVSAGDLDNANVIRAMLEARGVVVEDDIN